MKYIRVMICSLFLALFAGVVDGRGQELRQEGRYYVAEIRKAFDVQPGGLLDADKIRGGVEVVAWDRDRVEIVENVRIEARSEDVARRELDRDPTGYAQQGSTVRLRGSERRGRSEVQRTYVVRAPARFNVRVTTAGGGIHLDGLTGDVDVTTAGGEVDLARLRGRVDATTAGGGLHLRDIEGPVEAVTAGGDVAVDRLSGPVEVTTAGGSIDIVDVRGDVTALTAGGEMNVRGVGGRLRAETAGGDLRISDVRGTADVETAGGDIDLYDIGGPLEAVTRGGDISGSGFTAAIILETSAGDVELRDVRASVQVITDVGDIEVFVAGSNGARPLGMELQTGNGDIYVVLPARLPARIEAEVIRRSRYDRDDIFSDFPLSRDARGDRAGDVVRSTGTINGGGPLIFLRTEGGSIRIEKEGG